MITTYIYRKNQVCHNTKKSPGRLTNGLLHHKNRIGDLMIAKFNFPNFYWPYLPSQTQAYHLSGYPHGLVVCYSMVFH